MNTSILGSPFFSALVTFSPVNILMKKRYNSSIMGNHPINLTLRFILELAALFSLGYWGWTQNTGLWRILLTIALPLIAAVLWGTFRVNNDPGQAPVAVPGTVRLVLELLFFAAATLAFYASNRPTWGLIFGLIVLLHYVISYDRILWLIKQ